MKRCPICNAQCFDDMDVCFGCLHDFVLRNTTEEVQNDETIQVSAIELPEVTISKSTNPKIVIEFHDFSQGVEIHMCRTNAYKDIE